MNLGRIYQSTALSIATVLELDAKASHYLAHVLRGKLGDKLTVFNGENYEYEAVIRKINKKSVEIEIISSILRDVESHLELHLAQGIARGEKMDFIIQKAVELGIKTITPLITERCGVKLAGEREEKRLAHWRAIVISACEQCGRNFIPHVNPPVNLEEWLMTKKLGFVLSPHANEQLQQMSLGKNNSISILIGPEGGLSDEEVRLATDSGLLLLNLGPRILRTETATVAALSILQSHYGDMATFF